MAAYMVFIREGEVVDPEAMAQYQAGNRGAPPSPDMKPLVVYGEMEIVEGEGPDGMGMVILEFPDKQAAKDWYYSDSYQERAKLRLKGAPYRSFIVEGL
ncbi:MAG: DUF1330 domain-containing protein [Novosphingobium sp.]|nr:DUF1330 domain-containing protein [Novosphingobium sp.]